MSTGATALNRPIHTTLDEIAAFRNHETIVNDFANRNADIIAGRNSDWLPWLPKPDFLKQANKLWEPTANDVGPGNLNLGQGILQLQQYLDDPANTSDPLRLRKYENDYQAFAKDIVDPDSPTTHAITGLILRQGVEDYNRTFGAQFANASPDVQSALLTTYYKQGRNRFLANRQPLATTPQSLPDPRLGDGGPFVLDPTNFQMLQDALQGRRFINDGPLPGVTDTFVARSVRAACVPPIDPWTRSGSPAWPAGMASNGGMQAATAPLPAWMRSVQPFEGSGGPFPAFETSSAGQGLLGQLGLSSSNRGILGSFGLPYDDRVLLDRG